MGTNKAILLWVIALVVIIGGLLLYPRLISRNSAGGSVPCLISGIPLVQHIHPTLAIYVDGVQETIPHDIGLSGLCERAIHTHDTNGVIHVEAQDSRNYMLGDFFSVWEKPFERPGYSLAMTIQGVSSTEAANLILQDGQMIVIRYQKSP